MNTLQVLSVEMHIFKSINFVMLFKRLLVLVVENILQAITLTILLSNKSIEINMLTNTTNKNINLKRNNSTVFFLMVCMFVFSNTIFSQDIIEVSETNCVEQIELEINTQNQVTSLDSQMDFVGWFMGTKQAQNLDINKDKNTSTTSNKKQILSSGITPNRVLYRTFMKKVISQDSAIV